jgi:type IV pilus assembly protein PilA
LVVIIIIGILAAIALPSLLSQVNKGKQAEARQNIGALNRSQQAYYLENGAFIKDTSSLAVLGIGIKTQTVNYQYKLDGEGSTAPQYATNKAIAYASKTLRSYAGINATALGDPVTSELLTIGYVCESEIPTQTVPTAQGNVSDCVQLAGGVKFKTLGSK